MYPRALFLRDTGRATTSLYRLGPVLQQSSNSRSIIHAKVTAQRMGSVGQKREITNTNWRNEKTTAATRSWLGDKMPKPGREQAIRSAGPPRGHKYWGLTIFRCTYSDDEAWSQLLKLIREEVRTSAESHGAPDLVDAFNLKVFEDPSTLGSASKIELRKMFCDWRSELAVKEERIDESGASPILIPDGEGGTRGTKQRYNYFVQVDEESLYSIINRETKTHTRDYAVVQGHVNVISANWELPDPQYYAEIRAEGSDDEDPSDYEDPLDEGEESLEGCRLYDVGWMKMNISVFHVGTQQILEESAWDLNYVRPPRISDYF